MGDLKMHIKAVHNKIKDEKCQLCDYSTPSKSDLQKHIRQVHLNKRAYSCIECTKTFTTQPNLIDHNRSVHRKDLLSMECNKAFSTIKVVHIIKIKKDGNMANMQYI